MRIVQLSMDFSAAAFDCGDSDLNDFLLHEAIDFSVRRIGKTFLLLDGDVVAAYFCLFNDKISKAETTVGAWRKVKRIFPHSKHFSSYPAVKIGRFAVASAYKGTGLGSELMQSIKYLLRKEQAFSTFRFITVDAYLSAVPFYEKNGFKMLLSDDDDKHTRLMFYDIMEI